MAYCAQVCTWFPLGHPSQSDLFLLFLGYIFLGSLAFTQSYLNCIREWEPTSDWLDNSIFCKVLLLHVSYSAIHGNKYLLLWSIQKVSGEDKTDSV